MKSRRTVLNPQRRLAIACTGGVLLMAQACSSGATGGGACADSHACGGDPEGEWVVVDSCMVPYVRTASDEWCSRLVYDPISVKDGLVLGHEFLPLRSGTITYLPDHTYAGQFIFAGATTTYFPAACLKQHGVLAPTCENLATEIQTLANSVIPIIRNVICVDGDDGGCGCTYDTVTDRSLDDGVWRTSGNILTH